MGTSGVHDLTCIKTQSKHVSLRRPYQKNLSSTSLRLQFHLKRVKRPMRKLKSVSNSTISLVRTSRRNSFHMRLNGLREKRYSTKDMMTLKMKTSSMRKMTRRKIVMRTMTMRTIRMKRYVHYSS